MTVATVEEKQQRIGQVLERLAAAQAPQVRVRLFSRASTGSRRVRGLLNPAPGSGNGPASGPRPVDDSALPPPFRPDPLEWAGSLGLGEELHVVVDAPRNGHLHVFGLGTSGEVIKLLPNPGARAPVASGMAYLASPGSGVTPFFPHGSRAEPWVELGPANGFPERVLAIVTAEDDPLSASRLHPAWADPASAHTSAPAGFGTPSIEPLLSAWPVSAWVWGCCAIPVISAR